MGDRMCYAACEVSILLDIQSLSSVACYVLPCLPCDNFCWDWGQPLVLPPFPWHRLCPCQPCYLASSQMSVCHSFCLRGRQDHMMLYFRLSFFFFKPMQDTDSVLHHCNSWEARCAYLSMRLYQRQTQLPPIGHRWPVCPACYFPIGRTPSLMESHAPWYAALPIWSGMANVPSQLPSALQLSWISHITECKHEWRHVTHGDGW